MPTIAIGSGIEEDPTSPSRMLLVMLEKAWTFVKISKDAPCLTMELAVFRRMESTSNL